MENILFGDKLNHQFYVECNRTLDDYLLDTIQNSHDRTLMINVLTEEKLLVSDFLERSRNLAKELQDLGCTKDAFVGIICENRLEFPVVLLATILSGSVITCLNPMYTCDELRHTVSASKPFVLFCSSQVYKKVKSACGYPFSKYTKHIILLDTIHVQPEYTTLLYSDLIKKSKKPWRKANVNLDDTAVLLYSSGTTGLSKGVMLSHRNVVLALHLIKMKNVLNFHGEYALGILPMFHSFGFMVSLTAITTLNHTLLVVPKFKEELFFSLIEKYKVEFLHLVPPLAVLLLKSPLTYQYDLSSIKNIVCGAAPLKIATEIELVKKLKLRNFRQAYGMTETTYVCLVRKQDSQKWGSAGCLAPGIQGKVVDIDTKKTLGPEEVGEICFKSPFIMKGYLNCPKDTEFTIRGEWLHTGDLGYYDTDGDFFVIDRLKELIKYKACQVAPTELEALLLRHKDVKEAAVVGLPDDEAGELPKAFVVKQAGSKITENELKRFIAENISAPKHLRGGVTFVDEIPKTASGKILRRVLKQQYVQVKISSKY